MRKFRKQVRFCFHIFLLLLFNFIKYFLIKMFFTILIGELYYMDTSVTFKPLNTSIILFYTSCIVGALLLALFVTSDKLKITLEKAINLLKTILLPYAFFGYSPQVRSIVFITDNSNAKCNALELYWSNSIHLLYTFHILQAF